MAQRYCRRQAEPGESANGRVVTLYKVKKLQKSEKLQTEGSGNSWCERGDSNPHGLTRQILSSPRTENERLARIAKDCDQLRQLAILLALTVARIVIRRKWSGLVVGTKLGTVTTIAF